MTDEELIEIRESLLPSQGEQFDVLEFGRAVDKRNRAAIDELVRVLLLLEQVSGLGNSYDDPVRVAARAAITKHTQPKEQA